MSYAHSQTSGRSRQSRLQLRDVMHSQVAVIGVDTPLGEAARRMRALNVLLLPVCDDSKLVGMIAARDLTLRATAEGLDPQTNTVRELMTRPIICIDEDQDLRKAAAIMRHYNLFLLPVVNRQRDLVGMIYFNDVNRFL